MVAVAAALLRAGVGAEPGTVIAADGRRERVAGLRERGEVDGLCEADAEDVGTAGRGGGPLALDTERSEDAAAAAEAEERDEDEAEEMVDGGDGMADAVAVVGLEWVVRDDDCEDAVDDGGEGEGV